jgi:hypothetical protein
MVILRVLCERLAGRPLRSWGRLRWMPRSLIVAGLAATRRVIRKYSLSINKCDFRPSCIMCRLLLVLITDCQPEGLASHVTVTAITLSWRLIYLVFPSAQFHALQLAT